MTSRGRSPYFDEAGLPILKRSVVGYVDELGVTEALRNFDDENVRSWSRQIDRLHEDIGAPLGSSAATIAFSDNFVTAAPIESDTDSSLTSLEAIPVLVSGYQQRLAIEGRLHRGAVVLGNIFVGDDRVIGPALVEAYEVENSRAVFPRILVGKPLLQLVLEDMRTESSEYVASFGQLYVFDSDGEVFLNYLSHVQSYLDEQDALDALTHHREVGLAGLRQYADQPRIRMKYTWLIQYHNWFCTSVFPGSNLETASGLSRWERSFPRSFAALGSKLSTDGELLG